MRARLAAIVAAAFALGLTAPAGAAEETPPLRFCADPDNLPFSSQGDATPGFYVELGRAIAAKLGRAFEPVWVPTWFAKRAIRTTLLAGKCDGFVGVPDDPELGPRLIFSKPIEPVGYALVTQKPLVVHDLSDLSGKRVAVQFGSPPQDLVAARNDIQAVTVLSPEEGMRDLAEGKADAGFLWGPSASWVNKITLHEAYDVVPVAGPRLQFTAGIAFPREQTTLRDQIDGALAALTGTINSLAAKYGFPDTAPVTLAAATTTGAPEPQAPAPAEHAAAEPAASAPLSPAGSNHAAEIAAGHKLFNDNCAHCHGPDAIQGERRINLRLLRHKHGDEMDEVFITTVTHGRVTKGMPNWSAILTDDQFRKILAYLHSVQEP